MHRCMWPRNAVFRHGARMVKTRDSRRVGFQSARGLAHSKTLREVRKLCEKCWPVGGSASFPLGSNLSHAHRVRFVEAQNLISRQRDLLGRVAQFGAIELNAALFDQATGFSA